MMSRLPLASIICPILVLPSFTNIMNCLARNAHSKAFSRPGLSSTFLSRAFNTTSILASTASSSSPYSFLPANKLPQKKGRGERINGLTEIRGSYYNPVTHTYLNELLSDWGEFVDGVKFAGGAFSLMPPDRLKSLIDMIHSHGCYVSTGGFIERVISTSAGDKATIVKYLETCKEMGCVS